MRLAAGEIVIDPTLDGRVAIDLVGSDEESQRLADEARVELHDRKVLVDVPQKRGGFGFSISFGRSGIDCRIRCPEGSDVRVRTKSAGTTVHGTRRRAARRDRLGRRRGRRRHGRCEREGRERRRDRP